jgi:DNA polymerase-1
VFLFNGGGVGSGETEVDVEVDDSRLQGYTLPEQPEDVREAIEASLRFLELTDLRITGPLWAAMYLAPLGEIVEPDFVIFVYGKTGAMKSTITALALNHYGPGWDYNRMPANWNDTRTALEMKAFLVKDAPLVVDDYARDVRLARSHDRKAEYLIRNWANRTSRARRTSNLDAQKNFPPRGLVISSGEQLPSGQSIIGRSFPIEVVRDDLVENEAAMEQLNACQAERKRYAHAMTGYLLWLRDHWGDLKRDLPGAWQDLRDHRRFAQMTHQRIPAVIAKLYVGFDQGMKFAVAQGALTAEDAQEWRNRFFDALLSDAMDHSILVEEEDPIDRFVRIIRDDFAQGKIWVEGTKEIADIPQAGSRTPYAEKLGFVDRDFLYLFGESALSYIQERCRKAGQPYPLNRNAFYSGLTEAGIAVPGSNYTTLQYKGPNGQNHRVLKVYAKKFGLEPQEKIQSEPEPVEF